MIKSSFLEEIRADERVKTKQKNLVHGVQIRFRSVPPDLIDLINSTRDESDLNRFLDAIYTTDDLDEFRAAVGH